MSPQVVTAFVCGIRFTPNTAPSTSFTVSDVPPGNKRYLICSRKIEEMTLLRLNRAINDYLLGSMASNPAGMAATP